MKKETKYFKKISRKYEINYNKVFKDLRRRLKTNIRLTNDIEKIIYTSLTNEIKTINEIQEHITTLISKVKEFYQKELEKFEQYYIKNHKIDKQIHQHDLEELTIHESALLNQIYNDYCYCLKKQKEFLEISKMCIQNSHSILKQEIKSLDQILKEYK